MSRPVAGLIAALLCLVAVEARADIINGGFESGDFTGWIFSGFLNPAGGPSTAPSYQTFLAAQAAGTATADSNAVETSQTTSFDGHGPASSPPIGPTEGTHLAFISNETSAGDDTLTGSSILQGFVVPTGSATLAFDLRLLSNEDPLVFSSFDDFGGVALTQGSTVLAQYNLDLAGASGSNGSVTGGTNLGGFNDSTSWISASFDVSALGGQTVTLTAYALNYGGDNFTESRLLLDNVHLTAVPEPGTAALATLVMAGFLACQVRRRGRCRRRTGDRP